LNFRIFFFNFGTDINIFVVRMLPRFRGFLCGSYLSLGAVLAFALSLVSSWDGINFFI
jgi:hypothetical protein